MTFINSKFGCEKMSGETGDKSRTLAIPVFIIAVIVITAIVLFHSSTIQQPKTLSVNAIKAQAINVNYDSLFRYNENYVGRIVSMRGQIIQSIAGPSDTYFFRISTKEGALGIWFEDVILANYQGSRLLEKDTIVFWGRVKGLRTYTSVLGQEITLPEVDILYVELESK
jgi:uncharacterized protein YdeI (BOF family)